MAFTLAEVLITLVVIGIVSAITVPILKQSTEGKEYTAARQKMLMTLGQAGRQMAMAGLLNQAEGTTAETFVKDHFSKYVKIAKHCGSNPTGCGFSSKIKTIADTEIDTPTQVSALSGMTTTNGVVPSSIGYAFTLANGYSVNLFYNPQCTTDTNNENFKAPSYVCINAIYDMNGKKKPNKVGKDIGFVSVLYPDSTSVAVAPAVYEKDAGDGNEYYWYDALQACSDIDKKLIVPSKDELLSIRYNSKLIANMEMYGNYWSSSEYSEASASNVWGIYFSGGALSWTNKANLGRIRCIWR